ncbi:MAG: DUF47 family protein [Saprospiraceae bacterium]|nr:DUF47 family protein [Saprospiraceae bacterium]
MIVKLLSLIFFFVVGWIAYTQFFGTPQEQKMGQEVISNGKETIQSVFKIFFHEGEKIQDGTYDETIEKIGELLDNMRKQVKDGKQTQRLDELEKEKDRITEDVHNNTDRDQMVLTETNKKDLKNLIKNIDLMLDNMEVQK